jgi:asparagine synthase (glutamine-hydrolysing)
LQLTGGKDQRRFMCGIAGIFDFTGPSPVDQSLLVRITDTIAHRGPDGAGYHVEGGLGLGHRRLAIIDVAHGRQPMFNEDGSVAVVFNGEIYNFQDLVAELRRAGHRFRTACDTEVIVHAWEQWGADCVKRFRGMFAFALYDRKKQTLFLARDRLGKKPLYYTIAGGRFLIFASELKALLAHPMVEKRLDPSAVDDYFAFGYVPDPSTIYEGISKLPPAHHMTVTRGKSLASPREYWRLYFRDAPADEDTAARELIARLNEAVRIRLISEVPLGAFLSGGVDSSGVVASMARQTDSPVETFAIGFGEAGSDELAHAARVSRLYRTHHHEQQVAANPLAAYRAQAAIFDEPFADSSSVPTYQVCKLARRDVTVALSGDAGDEMFAGYRRYRWFHHAEKMRRLVPASIRKPVFGSLGRLYPKLDWAPRWLRAKYTFQEFALDSAGGYYRTVCRVQDEARSALYGSEMRRAISGHHPGDRIVAAMRDADSGDSVTCAQYADIKTYLAGDILTKVDRTSMAVSLEVRVPMLDHEFVEWAARLPSGLKLHQGEGKHILKRALEPYVPKENLYRPKQGFATSLAPHFRGTQGRFVREALLGEAMRDCGIFDISAIARVVDAHESGAADHSHALWSLLMFDGFLREVHFTPGQQRAATRPTTH